MTWKWTEADSSVYRDLAAVAVPDRAEQMATLLTLLPFGPDEAGRVIELGCGEGRLTRAILEAFPKATALALDGSQDMQVRTIEQLRPFGTRAEVGAFALDQADWWPLMEGADTVVSSLTVHHLNGAGKQRLFRAVAGRLSPRGALSIADIVEPKRAEALELSAAGWDRAAERQSQTAPGSRRAFDQFLSTRWNVFRHPDPVDMPSPVFEQLLWLREAGFLSVDCFWLRAGHAVYGGYRATARTGEPPLPFATALRIAEATLQ
jgi:tRNA (cmo5U34)-methyltransferase